MERELLELEIEKMIELSKKVADIGNDICKLCLTNDSQNAYKEYNLKQIGKIYSILNDIQSGRIIDKNEAIERIEKLNFINLSKVQNLNNENEYNYDR